jgi:hypothetical protein
MLQFKHLILTLLLIFAAAPARADWVKVGQTEKTVLYVMSEKTVFYIDPATITKDGNLRKVWEIHDLSEKGPRGERSILIQVEYDCAEKLMRPLHASAKSRPMGQGEILKVEQPAEDWITLRPDKEGEVFLKILNTVCAP